MKVFGNGGRVRQQVVHNARMGKSFKQGDHICALYESEHEQLTIAAAYVADGLAHAERCYYVGQSPLVLTRFRESLAREGVDVADAVKGGALILAIHQEAHLAQGRFDCKKACCNC